MIPITPSSIAFQIGPLPVYWYGICYAVGLAAAYLVMASEARRRGFDVDILANGMIIVAVAALIGGRAYHVIDQWQLYKDDPLKIILPPYSGLGVYGGLAAGVVAAVLYARWRGVPFWPWADVVAPGLFVMQAIGRWGNFFNQELYGPPTSLPWGIAIDCAHRLPEFPCETFPLETTGFHPLFLYESISGLLGAALLLWLARRHGARLRNGDLILVFFIWYPIVRFALETLRTDNWRLAGVPTAQLVSVLFVALAFVVLVYRHRPGFVEPEPVPVRARRRDEERFDEELAWDDELDWDGDEASLEEAEGAPEGADAAPEGAAAAPVEEGAAAAPVEDEAIRNDGAPERDEQAAPDDQPRPAE